MKHYSDLEYLQLSKGQKFGYRVASFFANIPVKLWNFVKKVGSVLKVLIDTEDARHYVGRTEHDSPDVDDSVLIPKKEKLKIGEFYPVRIDKADSFDLYGTKV